MVEEARDALCEMVCGVREVFERGEGKGAGEVGRRVERRIDDICDRAIDGKDQLDAADALTFDVRLVLDNEQGTYEYVRELARDHLRAADPCPVCAGTNTAGDDLAGQNTECRYCGPAGTVKRHPHQLGERLREYAEDQAGLEGEGLGCLARELLSTALAWVDWDALAAIVLSEFEDTADSSEPSEREAA